MRKALLPVAKLLDVEEWAEGQPEAVVCQNWVKGVRLVLVGHHPMVGWEVLAFWVVVTAFVEEGQPEERFPVFPAQLAYPAIQPLL